MVEGERLRLRYLLLYIDLYIYVYHVCVSSRELTNLRYSLL